MSSNDNKSSSDNNDDTDTEDESEDESEDVPMAGFIPITSEDSGQVIVRNVPIEMKTPIREIECQIPNGKTSDIHFREVYRSDEHVFWYNWHKDILLHFGNGKLVICSSCGYPSANAIIQQAMKQEEMTQVMKLTREFEKEREKMRQDMLELKALYEHHVRTSMSWPNGTSTQSNSEKAKVKVATVAAP